MLSPGVLHRGHVFDEAADAQVASSGVAAGLFISEAVGGHDERQVLISEVFQQAREFTNCRGRHCRHGRIFSAIASGCRLSREVAAKFARGV